MGQFIIKDDFLEIFPNVEIAIVLARGINNRDEYQGERRKEISKLLRDANVDAEKFLTKAVFSENPEIAVWREAFQKFKTKKGVRCSIEALLKRIEKGIGVSEINPLVDIYNSVSLTYGLPCGGEDMDTFVGDIILTKAKGGEPFMALGDEGTSEALAEEIIYKDEEGAICRCWNWRDGQRTMLTENTVNAFLIIESVDPSKHDDLIKAAEKLAGLTEEYLGGEVSLHYMGK